MAKKERKNMFADMGELDFHDNEPTESKLVDNRPDSKFAELSKHKKDKYNIALRLDASLEAPLREAANELGLSVTKYIEVAIREKMKRG